MATIYKNRKLVYLCIIFFFYFASIGCLVPFLTTHMRHLGFSLPEISFINAVAAFASLIGPVVGGAVAEKHSKYKCVTIICILIGAVSFSALSFVPRSERLHYRPLVDFSCRSGLRIERCANWASCGDGLPNLNSTTIHLTQCQYQCSKDKHISPDQPMHICFNGDQGNICVVYDSENGNMSSIDFDTQLFNWPFDEKQEHPGGEGPNATEKINVAGHDIFESSWFETLAGKDPNREMLKADVEMCNYHPSGIISLNQKTYSGISCRPTYEDCGIHCHASFSVGGEIVLPNVCEEANGDPSITFWSYLILRCIGDLCLLTAVCLLDALIVSNTSDFEGAYGRMHVWPALAFAAFSPFSGALLDHYTDMSGRADFSPSVFVSVALAVLTCALIIALPIHNVRSSPKFQSLQGTKDGKNTKLTFELFAFVVVVIVLGMQWGVIFTFLPWLIMDIGCNGMMTGLSYTFIFGCCLPFLIISKNLVRNIGRANLLVFSLLFYGTRYAGVSYVFSPWWTLPFAAMGSFTLGVMWIASVAYGQSLVTPRYHIAMQFVLNMLHFGIGRGLGSLLGGTLISHHGQRVMFRGVAVFSACLGFLYLAIYHLGIKVQKPKHKKKGNATVPINGSAYPLRDQRQNGNSKIHHSMLAEQDEDDDFNNDDAQKCI